MDINKILRDQESELLSLRYRLDIIEARLQALESSILSTLKARLKSLILPRKD